MNLRPGRTVGQRAGAGFTLVEVLLAFVIFALSFATVLEILGGSMRSTMRARADTEVALLAQSLIDLVGTEFPVEEGSRGGMAPGGYSWQLVVSPYQPQFADERTVELAEANGTGLYQVDLEVSWGDRRRMRQANFSTVRSTMAGRQTR